jgi:Tol biopolymer transport system component
MGEVYRARDTRLGREVALKVLPEALAEDPGRLARFEQEARAASALNHPNIVTIHDIGREGTTEYIAMELVDGRTLREVALSELPIRKILAIAAQIADGLAKAHAAGIVHRDLKPENLMMTRDGFVKILDFGLAKLTEPQSGEASAMPTLAQPETRPGTVMGTVSYMSPEQASGEPVDYRSDQFSLGSILYEVACGKKAFPRKTAAETMAAIIRDEPESLAKLRPDLPIPLRWIVDRCLAKDPDERYASTRDLARDLAGVRDHISEVSGGVEAAPAAPRARHGALPWVALGLVAGLAAGWLLMHGGRPSAPAPTFTRVTFRKGNLGNARFAPDGKTIVYGAKWDDDPVRERQLYQTRIGSPESGRFEFPADILSISPNGELAILWKFGGRVGTLARVPMSGGVPPRPVLEDVVYGGADFSPDGKDFAVAHLVDGRNQLEYPIGKVLVPENADSLRFSPSGDAIAFWEGSGTIAVSMIDPEGRSKRVLSPGWESGYGVPCWSPDGREVWFTATKLGQTGGLWAVDRSGKQRLLLRVPGELELDDVSRDGRLLLAHHTSLSFLRARQAGATRDRDLSWLDASILTDLTPDGKTILITEFGLSTGRSEAVYLRSTDGSPAVKLGDGTGFALSPDGKWVLGGVRKASGKGGDLILLPTGPGQTRILETPAFTEFDWGAWLPDGSRVVFSASSPTLRRRLYVAEVAGGKPREIGPEGAGLLRFTSPVSPDGRFAFGSLADDKRVLFRLDGAGGEPIPLPGLDAGGLPIQWSPDGQSLYVFQRGLQRSAFLLDWKTGERRLWKEPPIDIPMQTLRVTPDGISYAYSGTQIYSELYVVEGVR